MAFGIDIVLILAFILIFLVYPCHSAEPQSAVIEFTSAEDLIARRDSVIAVCDTVSYPFELADSDSLQYDSCKVFGTTVYYYRFFVDSDTIWQTSPGYRSYVYLDSIRHRTFVGVTVVEPLGLEWFRDYEAEKRDSTLMSIYRRVSKPGTAIVWWE